MSRYDASNIFEKIGSFIPGYRGYAQKERRRDTDKLLRLEIAKHIDLMKEILNDVIRQQADRKEMNIIKDLDRLKRNLDITANQIRHASCGESGLFDVVQVYTSDLDKLYQFDLGIKDDAEQLAQMIKKMLDTENIKQDCEEIVTILSALSEKVTNRDKVIAEVR
jgi:hypothetical protein